jgi:hypothetical protein
MEGSRISAMAPWALASIGAACAVQSARSLAVHQDLPVFMQALGVLGLALSAFLFIRMLFKRVSGDMTWGAPPYTATQAHLIFWTSLVVAIGGAAMWIWRGS